MKEYEVRIIETSSRVVTVTASSGDMAEKIVARMYRDEDIVLDYSDFDYVNFDLIGELIEE
jgi:hypothetical protein